jgi:RNA polymerase sigma factor (sigma-70 family)
VQLTVVSATERIVSRAQLMERARTGDREAFHVLFEETGPLITRFLRRHLIDRAELEDVCQEVLMAVYRSRHTYDAQRPFEPWLFAIVRKVSGEHLRRSRRQTASQVYMDNVPEVGTEDAPSLTLELRRALEELPPAQMEALNLTKLLGLSVEEASRRAGTTVGSMKVRVHRAYESLKRSLIR